MDKYTKVENFCMATHLLHLLEAFERSEPLEFQEVSLEGRQYRKVVHDIQEWPAFTLPIATAAAAIDTTTAIVTACAPTL